MSIKIDKSKIKDFPIRMECSSCSDPLVLVAARIDEGFNEPSRARIEFISDTPNIDLDDLMGRGISLTAKVPDGADRLESGARERKHVGICVNARFVGTYDGACHYWAEIRPRMWFLSLNKDCRIFQDKTAPDIIKEVLQDYGVTFDERLSESYRSRVICVQYRETDLAFIHRLMEEEGIHYFFEYDGDEKMVLHDDSAAHTPVPADDTIRFLELNDPSRRDLEHFFEWYIDHAATTGKYTQTDYNFEKPKADLETFRSLPKGKHDLKEREIYDYPGHYRETSDGEFYSKVRMEERAIHYRTWRGTGLVSNIEVGKVFKVSKHEVTGEGEEFVVRSATHLFQLNERELNTLEISHFPSGSVRAEIDFNDPYQVRVLAIPKQEKFRPAPVTPWPEIAGCHTAVVTGPSGEEIYTDKYGRIRIQFHWDRLGKMDEKSTCWVRCMMPWTGKKWGMIGIPRMGQEVVVQFEEGDPDRPLVIGMLYNADTMPPYELPANMTQTGIKSRSTKEGSNQNFNELRFEDKKGEEEVYFHAEKNYNQVVENDATIKIGFDDMDKGDLTQEIYHDKTEEVGNDLKVKIGYGDGGKSPGDMTHEVYNDRTETIGNNFKTTVQKGDHENTVKKGNMKNTVSMGNFEETISMGNHTTKVSLGKTEHEAMQSIELKVGANSIKIDQSGVTIKGIMVKIEAQAMAQTNAPMVKINGSGMVMIQGGLVKIN
ncbi:type VI secretion system Vgr family protein [Aliiruegeria lutimaris]|uniref:Type VI secretion system secreted protein VgrG n=1 Tax=Aliiruegeria lutimaris TaxID=571298 RepID=A0A1G8K632_9RHOB|nr:type VI secretion system tip protein TssI/VgrG [Aliiruegeria lutimaris]SDI38881.1 type VI secretion system secreted protein VgrG [Aliiruegeria lutimaris]